MPFFTDLLARTKLVKYLPDLFTLANLYNKATNDDIPGFTVDQYHQLVDTAYTHLPGGIKITATSAELQTLLVSGQTLFFAGDKAIDMVLAPAKAFWAAIKAVVTV